MPNATINRRVQGGARSFPLAPLVASWAAACHANGDGVLPNFQVLAVNTFYWTLFNAGLWSKMLAVNPIAPGFTTVDSALTPLLQGGFSSKWNQVGGTNTNNALGLAGNGSSLYYDTGFNPSVSVATPNSWGLVMYCYSAGTANTSGQYDIPSGTGSLIYYNNGGNAFGQLGEDATKVITPAPGNGYFSVQRTASNNCRFYFGNSTTAHAQIGSTNSTARSAAFPSISFVLGVLSSNIGLLGYDAGRTSFMAFTSGLSIAEDAVLFAAVQALRQNGFGSGYV